MSLSERDPLLPVTEDHSVAEVLREDRLDGESALAYVNRVYSGMRGEPEYLPILRQLNRMGGLALGNTVKIRASRVIAQPAFFMGQVLGLDAMETVLDPDVKDRLSLHMSRSLAEAQRFATHMLSKDKATRAEKSEKWDKYIGDHLLEGTKGKFAVDLTFEEERELIISLAQELAPDNLEQQQQIIQGYIFVRYRTGDILNPENSDEDDAEANQEESPSEEGASPDLRSIESLENEVRIDRFNNMEVTTLDDIRARIIELFEARMEKFEAFDINDRDEVKSVIAALNTIMKDTILREGIDITAGDEIKVTGNTAFLPRAKDKGSQGKWDPSDDLLFMDGDEILRGYLKAIEVELIPKEDVATLLKRTDTEQIAGDAKELTKIQVVFNLSDIVVLVGDKVFTLPTDAEYIIPLEYKGLQLGRVET